jgi:hypothetical protein
MARNPTALEAAETSTPLDRGLSFDAIYYSAPIPRDSAVLTVLGVVFDHLIFPDVYLPKDGFDQSELDKEIERLKGFSGPSRHRHSLIPMLEFVKYAKVLDGFCIFSANRENPFLDSRKVSGDMVRDLYFAIHGPGQPGWEPGPFSTAIHKGLPGGTEHVTYPDDYCYLANAVIECARRGIPLINDLPGLPIPGAQPTSPQDDAKSLATILAIECTKLVLPDLPLLRPEDLMEFRAENTQTLRSFRRAMLQYAADLNGKIAGLSSEDIAHKTKFFIDTEIVPSLDHLRESINQPSRPWYRRLTDFGRISAEIGAGYFTMEPHTLIATVFSKYAAQFMTEIAAKGDQKDVIKRSGLYYLLRLQTFVQSHKW